MAPMNVGGLNESDGKLSKRGIDYFVERARGGTGLIVVGLTRVTREFEQSQDTNLVRNTLADDKIHVSWLNELAEACHDHETKVAVQLSPGVGRQAGGYSQGKGLAIGPSDAKCFWPPHLPTRPLTKVEIKIFLDAFQLAAYHLKMAGIDAVQLHGHEGYLLDQFQSLLWNHRTDEYGGTLRNRMRFSEEIIKSIRKGAGEDFPIIYRYGLVHEMEGGRTETEGLQIATILEQAGVDALDIDSGCYETWHLAHPPSTIDAGFKLELAAKVKKQVYIPVIASGKLGYPDIAEEALVSGTADFISLGRPLIADPEWVKKLAEGKSEDIRPCIGCHEGCLKRIYDHKSISCAVNPAAGNEKELAIELSRNPRKILVVGGGVAGMESVRTLLLRGHQVWLVESNPALGGNFRPEYLPAFKHDYLMYVRYLEGQISKLGANVLLGHPFTQNDLQVIKPELVVLACGAKHILPSIPGLNRTDRLSVLEAFSSRKHQGRITVLGGGLVGAEAAINLAMNGASVTLIEKQTEVARDAFMPNRMHLKLLMEQYKVKVLTNTCVTSIEENTVNCLDTKGNIVKIKSDKIVVCLGMFQDRDCEKTLGEKGIEFIRIGDCNKPGKVIDSVWEAYRKLRLV